ncbi:MAG: hypothetical protein WBG43_06130 [Marinifilaceae bacterium]
MKTIIKFCVFILTLSLFSSCATSRAVKKADADTKIWRYELTGEGTGAAGTYLVKVWSYSKKPQVAKEQSKKNAVHGIIFKGFTSTKRGISAQKALAKDANIEQENEQFFTRFFAAGGDYLKYVNLTNDGLVAAGDLLKVSKKEYKVGVIVSVRKDALRKHLEKEGIIRGLSTGF